jgi:hypothetical protein
VTDSVDAPTSSRTFTGPGTPNIGAAPLKVAVLKPGADALTWYAPPSGKGVPNSPRSLVDVRKTSPVAADLTSTSAEGTAAPVVSVTVPWS